MIPVTFDHKGKTFNGYFSEVTGAGTASAWQLYDNENYYHGQLIINARNEWVFTDQKMELAYLSDYFRDVVLAWYE